MIEFWHGFDLFILAACGFSLVAVVTAYSLSRRFHFRLAAVMAGSLLPGIIAFAGCIYLETQAPVGPLWIFLAPIVGGPPLIIGVIAALAAHFVRWPDDENSN